MPVSHSINGVDVDRLAGTIEAVNDNPALARFQFRASNHWIDGGHNRTTIKEFYGAGQDDTTRTEPFVVDTDEPPVLLGENRAPNAGEYVLHALAACLTGAIVYHAAARGIPLEALESTIEGDIDCGVSSASTRTSAPATRASASPSRPPATSMTISSPSLPPSRATRPCATSSATPSPSRSP